jgi:hypothetical protein
MSVHHLPPMPETQRVDNVGTDDDLDGIADVLTLGPGAERFAPAPASAGHTQRAAWKREASCTRSQAERQSEDGRAVGVLLAVLAGVPNIRLSVASVADLTGLTVDEVEAVEERLEALDLVHRLDARTVALGDGSADALVAALVTWAAR